MITELAKNLAVSQERISNLEGEKAMLERQKDALRFESQRLKASLETSLEREKAENKSKKKAKEQIRDLKKRLQDADMMARMARERQESLARAMLETAQNNDL